MGWYNRPAERGGPMVDSLTEAAVHVAYAGDERALCGAGVNLTADPGEATCRVCLTEVDKAIEADLATTCSTCQEQDPYCPDCS